MEVCQQAFSGLSAALPELECPQITPEPAAATLQLLLISHSRRWQVLLGSALPSAALGSRQGCQTLVQARCSTALRNRLPAALPVHQGTFIVLPHPGLAWMLGHKEPHAHDPPALAVGSVLTVEGIGDDRD